MCELQVHGSRAIVSSLLTAIGRLAGVRPAEPGEFTRRAFLNGKLSLLEAEAVQRLVAAGTDSQRRLALSALSGQTGRLYQDWSRRLLKSVAYMEAYIEFGEDQLLDEQRIELQLSRLAGLREEVAVYLRTAVRRAQLVNAGVELAIVGQPNVGKSSLINQLCEQAVLGFSS